MMNMSVCVCVCLSARIFLEPHVRSSPIILCICLWLWLGPRPAGWRNSKGMRQFWGFSSPLTMHCNVLAAVMSRSSRRDHSVTAGGDGSAQTVQAKCDLGLPCFFCVRATRWLSTIRSKKPSRRLTTSTEPRSLVRRSA